MRVVWCLEPLKRSSLEAQRVGWAGRAAVTCSPFFTLMLGEGKQGLSRGRDPAGKTPAKPPGRVRSDYPPPRRQARKAQVSHVALPSPGPRTTPPLATGHRPSLAFEASQGPVQGPLQLCQLFTTLVSLHRVLPHMQCHPRPAPSSTCSSSRPPAPQVPVLREAVAWQDGGPFLTPRPAPLCASAAERALQLTPIQPLP